MLKKIKLPTNHHGCTVDPKYLMSTELKLFIITPVSILNLDVFVRSKSLNCFAVDFGHLAMLCLVLISCLSCEP